METVLRKLTRLFRGDCRETYRRRIATEEFLCYAMLQTEQMPCPEMKENSLHLPVLLKEVLEFLNLENGKIIVDATIGWAGHSEKILEKILPEGLLVGIDLDEEALSQAEQRLKHFGSNYRLLKANFRDIDSVLSQLKIEKIDGILFDLGSSLNQLMDPRRGFSFRLDGPLDMRFDTTQKIKTFDLVNHLTEEELVKLLKKYGEEYFAKRIARAIVRERKKGLISTTSELSEIIYYSVAPKYRFRHIHPATKTFQALRIAVNHELENLEEALNKVIGFLQKGARLCVISFHSLEDRIVKNKFRQLQQEGILNILTNKPVSPSKQELTQNPRARSAKMRVGERL